jgi:hypothetical protein
MPDPVVRMRMRGCRRERDNMPARGCGRVKNVRFTPPFSCVDVGSVRVVARLDWRASWVRAKPMISRVQSPALDTTMEVSFGRDGNVAKGCHSRSGLEEMERQLNLWMGLGNERRMACEERTCAVKVQRRMRSQGYISSRVMKTRFQNVGLWVRRTAV